MAEGIEHPGLEALLDCRRQVEESISEDIYEVADFLRTRAIIDSKLYHAVTDSTSYKTGQERARMLLRQLEFMVEEDEKYYEIFTEYLRQYPDKFAKTINMLDKAYSENGGIISYAAAKRMGDEVNLGLKALSQCAEQVRITIRNYMTDIAGFLRKKNVGIIDLSLYTQVTDPRARQSIDDRAQLVYQRLRAMVALDGKHYEVFVDFLRKSPQKYEKTVSMLDKAYADNSGVVISEQDSASRTKLNEGHYSELCEQLIPAKFAWEDIARSLGFHPSEIAAIRGNLTHTMFSDYIFYAIEFYLRWAPGDGRGSKDVATLEALQAALDENNCGIKLSITSKADQQAPELN